MVSCINKWFAIIPLLLIFKGTHWEKSSRTFYLHRSAGYLSHPFHVSVVEINHNASEKTLEISCKIFTDDFEKVLAQNYKTKTDLINPPVKAVMDTLVKKYILSHLFLEADGKPVLLTYLGFERENEAVYSYVEAGNIPAVKKIVIQNTLMHDLFTDQINLMHVKVNGIRKSSKLDYPQTRLALDF